MSIPNVSSLSKRIKEGSEGGNEFARLITLLLSADAKKEGKRTTSFSDATGDYKGVDFILNYANGYDIGYQYKFFPSPLSSNHKNKITEAIRSAIEKFEGMRELVIVTPDDMNKHDLAWFKDVELQEAKKVKMDGDYDFLEIKTVINHLGHTQIVNLLLKHPYIGKKYYPELFKYDVDLFRLINYSADDNLLFDFSFINDSDYTYLLNAVDIIKIESWSALSGLPEEHYLKSAGEIEFTVDMHKEINTKNFENPIILPSGKPFRFKMQLLKFYETMPGNCIEFKFRFHFNNNEFFIDSEPKIIQE